MKSSYFALPQVETATLYISDQTHILQEHHWIDPSALCFQLVYPMNSGCLFYLSFCFMLSIILDIKRLDCITMPALFVLQVQLHQGQLQQTWHL